MALFAHRSACSCTAASRLISSCTSATATTTTLVSARKIGRWLVAVDQEVGLIRENTEGPLKNSFTDYYDSCAKLKPAMI